MKFIIGKLMISAMVVLLALSSASCNLFEKEDDDNSLQLLTLAWLLNRNQSNCNDDSKMVICIPPGFVQQ